MVENNNHRLMFSCSGAADVGELADKVVRYLAKDGFGKMYCLAGVGCKIDSFISTTQAASEIVAVDGCPAACAAKNLKQAGFDNFKHVIITEYGFEKGNTPVQEDNIEIMVSNIKLKE